MSTQNLHDGRIQLEAWGIAEFIREFQQLVKDGWWVDFEENDSYPINIGGLMHAKLHKLQKTEDFLDETEVSEERDELMKKNIESLLSTEEKPVKVEATKRGRPAKG